MAKKKGKTTKKKTAKKEEDAIKELIEESHEEAKVEEELLPEAEPEEVPEVEEEQPDGIYVSHTGYGGGGLTHWGRAKTQRYVFGGKDTKVLVTNPIDVEFFRMKAERNPKKWRVE
jgi:hypothetical protein